MLNIKIEKLAENISIYQAVENCYPEQIKFVWSRLREGMSVIIKCEKQIIPYLQSILKKQLAADGKSITIVDGRADPTQTVQNTRINNIVNQLRTLVNNTESNKVFILPYLDIITSQAQGSLSMESKEIMTIIHENPYLTFVAFEDPDFPIPELIAQAFPARAVMIGINRKRLDSLITSSEAKKFASDEINVMGLYKYVSGLNPVRFREIMQVFSKKADYNPNDSAMLKEYYRELREYTKTGQAELSSIHLNTDIAGYRDVKNKIKDNILGLLKKANEASDEKYIQQIESIIPKGMIFHGPPGTGKTLFAKGIAEAINATVYIVNGPELKSKWVGEGEANVRRLFAKARATAPSVIIFDEFDSIASVRTSGGQDGGSQASHSMVNQLLTEMDGFRKEELIFVIGTTNFVQSLDPAFLRPGRFEYHIEIPYPEWDDRKAILKLYNKKLETGLSDENIDMLCGWTERITETGTRYTGDHLNALIRNFKRYQINDDIKEVTNSELKKWLLSLLKSNNLEKDEEKVVAVHEIGHTMLYHKYNRLSDIKHVTIESGMTDALGMVELKNKKLENMYTEKRLKQDIATCLGGYTAEKIIFGQVSTGASHDLKTATMIAENMVTLYGMGNINIPRSYLDESDRLNPYFYNIISPQIDIILLEIASEVSAYLEENKVILQKLTDALLEKRTLTPDQVKELVGERI